MSLKALHLGCGERYLESNDKIKWIHIDLVEYDHIDFKNDVRDLSMFKSNAIDLIYNSHVFEYFDRVEGKEVLNEWYRVLKVGGILRLAVPDFEGIMKVYQKYSDIDHKGILGPLYGRRQLGDGFIYHRTCYDFSSLKKILEEAGFKNIKRYNPDDVLPESYDDQSIGYVPHCDRSGILVSLNVECEK